MVVVVVGLAVVATATVIIIIIIIVIILIIIVLNRSQDFKPTARATFNGIGGGCGGGGCGGAGGCSSGGDIGGWSGNNCYNIDSKQITKLPQAKNR